MPRDSTPSSLLDVGTGIGQFLHHALSYFSAVQGTEVSESAVRIAREKYCLEIHLGQVEDLNLPPASFDNIKLFHVLEHVPDPGRTLDECRRLMLPNAVLTIAVPNDVLAWTCILKRLGRKLGLKAFRKFSPKLSISKAGLTSEIHLSHFTPAVLRRLLQNHGFSVVEESLDPLYAACGAKLVLNDAYYLLHRALFACCGINRYEAIWMVSRNLS
jgi:2-polyprenyl-3-methyl-5-hydroxy-6-metoxy-1,4-benzoquinol methylase